MENTDKSLMELCEQSPHGSADDWMKADITLIEGALLIGDDSKFELSSQPAVIAVSWRNYRNHIEAWVKLHGEETPFGVMGQPRNEMDSMPEWKYAQEFARGLLTVIRSKVEAKSG